MPNVELSTVVDGVTIELNGSNDLAVKDLGISTGKIAADAVTFAKMQNIATDRLIGRDTAASGDPEEISIGGGLEFTGAGGIQRSALTGDVTASAGSNTTTIPNDTVTYAKMQNISATARILGRKTAAAGDTEECTLSEILDFIGSAAQGDILYRGSAAWARLAAGTKGRVLQTQGSGANPQWINAFELFYSPLDNEPPTTNPAAAITRNDHPLLAFDGTTDEEAMFTKRLPLNYNGNGLTLDTYWSFTSATSGSLRVQAAIERIDLSSLDLDADSFASFNSAGGTAPATSGQVIKVTIPFASGAEMDSLVAGELFRLKIRRDADGTSGTDDITTDAELVAAVLRET